jgi:hypothetical protein
VVNDLVNQNGFGLDVEPPLILVLGQERVHAGDADHI